MNTNVFSGIGSSHSNWIDFLKRWWLILLLGGIAINTLGLFTSVIEPDGALYATLSKTMVLTGNYVDLMLHGKDWLDKPHFPFWVTALSYWVFGINAFGYKLPAFLFWAISVVYTYKVARLFYSKATARLSVLIYVTSLHAVISNSDVRAEPYLMALIIGSVYHLYKTSNRFRWSDVVLGSLFAAFAVMTKGIFVLLTIGSGLFIHLVLKKEWNRLVNKQWLLVFILVIIFIIPELLCLYLQFDLHPEKLVFGHRNVSGIQFFLWDSQFGRFFNTGPIKGEGDPFFFLHTTLWSFFPWSLLFFAALFRALKNRQDEYREFVCWGTVIITFLLFSFSKFQLPHYLNIIFPFMSILCGQYISKLNPKKELACSTMFNAQAILALGCVLLLLFFFQPSSLILAIFWVCLWSGIAFFVPLNFKPFQASFLRNILISLMMYGFLSLFFVSDIAHYQAGREAAQFLEEKYKGVETAMLENDQSFSFDFYYPSEVQHFSIEKLKSKEKLPLLFCNETLIPLLEAQGYKIQIIKVFPHYHISEPRWLFINSSTRVKSLSYYAIVKII